MIYPREIHMAAPKKAMPKPKGKASIYKGTDKTTNKRDTQYSTENKVVYADGSTRKNVKTERGMRNTGATVRSEKNGNIVKTNLSAFDPITWGPSAGSMSWRRRSTETTLGKGGRRESVVKRGTYGNVISETQLARGTVRKGTVGKKKAY